MTTWWPLSDQFVADWWPLGDHFGMNWWLLGGHIEIQGWSLGDQLMSWWPLGGHFPINLWPLSDQFVAIWWPLGDHFGINWWLLGGHSEIQWWSLGDPLVTTLPFYPLINRFQATLLLAVLWPLWDQFEIYLGSIWDHLVTTCFLRWNIWVAAWWPISELAAIWW